VNGEIFVDENLIGMSWGQVDRISPSRPLARTVALILVL